MVSSVDLNISCYNYLMDDNYFMTLAISAAKESFEEGNWPIGCVIVLDGVVIAKGINKIYSTKNRLAHAEVDALQQAQHLIFDRPGEAVLYTTFEPCPMCFGACINSRLKKVVYGADFNGSGAVHLKDHLLDYYKTLEFKTEFIGGVLKEECKEVYMLGEPTKK
jgi:tRNA(adenine34) deaminase